MLRYTGEKAEKDITQVFSETMKEIFAIDDKVVYLDADLMGSLKSQELWHENPDRVFNCGIQEANMIGVAGGMYLAGYKPYVHTFSPFATRRVFDQVFLTCGYAKKSIRIIGSDVGIMATANGGTHMCFEDVAMMRTIPDACVIDVTDAAMFKAFLKQTKDREGVTYFRTARRDLPDIYTEETDFEEGKGKVLKDGTDVTIIASGIMVATALDAAALLEQDGVSVAVIDVVTIKPLDYELILKYAKNTKAIVTAENHSVFGGLGSAVSEYLSEVHPTIVRKIGVQDKYGQVGGEAFLRKEYHLTVEDIVEQVKVAIR